MGTILKHANMPIRDLVVGATAACALLAIPAGAAFKLRYLGEEVVPPAPSTVAVEVQYDPRQEFGSECEDLQVQSIIDTSKPFDMWRLVVSKPNSGMVPHDGEPMIEVQAGASFFADTTCEVYIHFSGPIAEGENQGRMHFATEDAIWHEFTDATPGHVDMHWTMDPNGGFFVGAELDAVEAETASEYVLQAPDFARYGEIHFGALPGIEHRKNVSVTPTYETVIDATHRGFDYETSAETLGEPNADGNLTEVNPQRRSWVKFVDPTQSFWVARSVEIGHGAFALIALLFLPIWTRATRWSYRRRVHPAPVASE